MHEKAAAEENWRRPLGKVGFQESSHSQPVDYDPLEGAYQIFTTHKNSKISHEVAIK